PITGKASTCSSSRTKRSWWPATAKRSPRPLTASRPPSAKASGGRRRTVHSPSTPMPSARVRSRACSEPIASTSPPHERLGHEHRHFRPVHHLLLGQWPRHDLSLSHAGPGRPRPPCHLL